MSPRKISTRTPNETVAQPATVQACQQDHGTPRDRAARAEDRVGQNETAKWHAKAAAEAPRGRR
jgi:hypothetical protein